jgi:hypothetical protein
MPTLNDLLTGIITPGQLLRHQCDVAKIQAGHDDGKPGCQAMKLRCPGCPWEDAWPENIAARKARQANLDGTAVHKCPQCTAQMSRKRMKWSCSKCGYKES